MPTGFQAGSAYSIYSLDLTQFDRDIARVKREIAALQKSTSVPVPSSGGGGASPRAASDQQAADAALRLASARANLARAEGDEARALQILNTALQQNSGATETASLRVQTAAARLQNGTTFAKEFGDGLKSGLLGVVAPAALATAAIGAVTATVQSFVGAFNFKAELDASTASIKSQLDGFRDANATYDEAIAFGRQYNITREETNAILGSSTDILRTSTASVGELETALIRLQSRDVSKPISEASRALRELQAGDTTSIKELFNIPAKDANKMKAEILAGGDAVKVLTNYLDSAKVGMTALGQRTQGAAGKMRELAQAQEDLKLAQADFAQGPGLLILQGQIRTTSGLTRVLSGDFSAMTSSVAQSSNDAAAAVFAWLNAMTGFVPVQQQATAATEQHAAAAADDAVMMAQGAQVTNAATAETLAFISSLQQSAEASLIDAAQKDAQQSATALMNEQARLAVDTFLQLNPTMDASAAASAAAAAGYSPQIQQLIVLAAQARETKAALDALAGGATEGRAERDRPGDRAQAAAAGAAALPAGVGGRRGAGEGG